MERFVASSRRTGKDAHMSGMPLGIDVGGSGVKGAPVDLERGDLAMERLKIATPKPATPAAVIDVIVQIVEHFKDQVGDAPIGVTIPGVVTHGIVRTAANIDKSWIGFDLATALRQRLGRPVAVLNDADAAGVAEVVYGAGRGVEGVVLVTTLGTGIGSALFVDGTLVPNTELGHIELDGMDAEKYAAASAREKEELSFKEYAPRLQKYYGAIEGLFWPDLLIVGGGISRKSEKFLPLLKLKSKIVPAELQNAAGIVGAAYLAAHSGK